jgi:hypothetical protein
VSVLLTAPTPALEHLTPHDLVTYSRCPYEMELVRAARAARREGSDTLHARTPLDVVPLRQSPLAPPLIPGAQTEDGRLDLEPSDTLVYVDSSESDLPVRFAPESVRLDPRFSGPSLTIVDAAMGLSGRPDFVVRRGDGSVFPVECKSTHLFTKLGAVHGRAFDTIQAIAECRLAYVAFGVRPAFGVVLYTDRDGAGTHEGWLRVPYGDAEERWLARALASIRADRFRAPVPSERHCAPCEPNRDGLCAYAASRPLRPVRGEANS